MAGDQFERPFETVSAPELSQLSDVPEWKQPDMDQRMEYWEEEQPYPTTGFETPTHIKPEDWW